MLKYFYLFSFAGAILALITSFIMTIGLFESVQEINDNWKCERKEVGGPGPEDLQVFNNRFLVFGQNDNAKTYYLYHSNPPIGSIKYIDLLTEEKHIVTAELVNFPEYTPFHPLGIYIFKDKLYVINKLFERKNERVEIFKISQKINNLEIEYERSISFGADHQGMLNDILVLSEKRALITIWHPEISKGKSNFFEFLSPIVKNKITRKKTFVYDCDISSETKNCVILANSHSEMNNGIAFDGNSRILISNTIEKQVMVYNFTRKQGKEEITFDRIVKLRGLPDNIDYDPVTNSFYIGTGIRILDFLKVTYSIFSNNGKIDQNLESWVAVEKISNEINPENLKSELIFSRFGFMRGLSVPVLFKGNFYFGSWYDDAIGICRVSN